MLLTVSVNDCMSNCQHHYQRNEQWRLSMPFEQLAPKWPGAQHGIYKIHSKMTGIMMADIVSMALFMVSNPNFAFQHLVNRIRDVILCFFLFQKSPKKNGEARDGQRRGKEGMPLRATGNTGCLGRADLALVNPGVAR